MSEANTDKFLPCRLDTPTPAKPKRTGENTGLVPVTPGSNGGKRASATDGNPAAGRRGAARGQTKTETVLKKLRLAKGISVAQLGKATGWQAHSVRGFLSAVVKKKLGLPLTSEVGKDGVRRYRVEDHTGQVC